MPAATTCWAQVGARIRTCLRPGDTAARLGGDEFAVLVEECPTSEVAGSISRRLAEAFGEPFVVGDRDVFVSVSLGIAFRVDGETSEELLRNADVAMYRAKARGKGRVGVYEPWCASGCWSASS
jgi:diguanylate cyclase (GGDEF)-like protein